MYDDSTLSALEVARAFRVDRSVVYRWIKDELLPGYRDEQGRWRIPARAVRKKLEEQDGQHCADGGQAAEPRP